MKTRQQYMNGECNHREYYSQFVSQWIRDHVTKIIGIDRLLASTDKTNLNDIPLNIWDVLSGYHYSNTRTMWNSKMKPYGDGCTLAGLVCVYKEAAKQVIELHNETDSSP